MEGIAFIIFGDLVTIPLTALICRYRIRRHKPISYGTMVGCAFLAAVMLLGSIAVYFSGWEVFLSIHGWMSGKFFGHATFITMLSAMTIGCIVPALAVVVCYRRRDKIDESHVA